MKFFCMVNGTPRNIPAVQMKFHVAGVEAALSGTWVDGKPFSPDPAEFRAALPYRWRKAFDRDGAFWHDRDIPRCRVTLRDRIGRYLATVYCVPASEATA